MKHYFKDYKLDTELKEKHQDKYRAFINLLIQNNNSLTINQEHLKKIFTKNTFKQIKKDNLDSIKEEDKPFTDLWHKTFIRTKKGNEYIGANTYSLRNYKDFLEEHSTKSFSSFIESKINKDSIDLENTIEIDKDYILQELKTIQHLYDTPTIPKNLNISEKRYLKHKRDYNLLLAIVQTSKDNTITIKYDRKKSGRLYTSHGDNLQGLTKQFRKILFAGWYEYDIEAAAPNYFLQTFNTIVLRDDSTLLEEELIRTLKALKVKTQKEKRRLKKEQIINPLFSTSREHSKIEIIEKLIRGENLTLDYYIRSGKKNIRELIAKAIAKNEYENDKEYFLEMSKSILTMIFFGANVTNTTYQIDEDTDKLITYSSLIEILENKKYIDNFLNDSLVRTILVEADIVMSVVYSFYKKHLSSDKKIFTHPNGDKYFKHVLKNYKVTKNLQKLKKSEVLSFLYQNYESKIMSEILQIINDENYFILHDGIYVKSELEKERISTAILKVKNDVQIFMKTFKVRLPKNRNN